MHGGHGHGDHQSHGKQSVNYAPDGEEAKAYQRGLDDGKKSSRHHH